MSAAAGAPPPPPNGGGNGGNGGGKDGDRKRRASGGLTGAAARRQRLRNLIIDVPNAEVTEDGEILIMGNNARQRGAIAFRTIETHFVVTEDGRMTVDPHLMTVLAQTDIGGYVRARVGSENDALEGLARRNETWDALYREFPGLGVMLENIVTRPGFQQEHPRVYAELEEIVNLTGDESD